VLLRDLGDPIVHRDVPDEVVEHVLRRLVRP